MNYVKSNYIRADIQTSSNSIDSTQSDFDVEILRKGAIKVNGKNISQKIDLYNGYDELRLLILDNPKTYLSSITIDLTLPSDVASEAKTEFLAVHGVGGTEITTVNSSTIRYVADSVSTKATLTIVAQLPKGAISPTFSMKLAANLRSIKESYWIIIAFILPIVTIVLTFLFLLFQRRRQKIDQPTEEISMPPMALPPAVVGVLFNKKVGARELAATLIDLAIRGDILILDQDRGFAFGKGVLDQRLIGYEKVLLSKIFRKHLTSDRQEIERRINNHLYSKKISMVAAGIYALATRLGYFKTNPQKYYGKYRLLGIFLFLVALAGFLANLFIFSGTAYFIFLWVGMMISALIIAFTAHKLPLMTAIGQETLSNWLAFKKYLSNPSPVPFTQNNQAVFQRYLPYAIVMNCEAAWAKRFAEHNFVTPEWFMTEKGSLGLEDFCLTLFPIVSYVGRSFAAIKEPGFE